MAPNCQRKENTHQQDKELEGNHLLCRRLYTQGPGLPDASSKVNQRGKEFMRGQNIWRDEREKAFFLGR